MQAFLRSYADIDLQSPMEAAVIIPSLLRPHLRDALESVFAQNFPGRIHILVGIDKPDGSADILDAACASRPSHCAVQVYWPGYSTSQRHGGLARPGDGGALRCVLSHLANSPYVAYLDDDNWWHPEHLRQMRDAAAQAQWSFALRWFVHPRTRRPICIDNWESVGPGNGIFKDRFGGFVDPNCLMINKLACPDAITQWLVPLPNSTMTADRNVFAQLARNHNWRCTGQPTVYYELNEKDGLHPMRTQIMGDAYIQAGQPLVAPASPPS